MPKQILKPFFEVDV